MIKLFEEYNSGIEEISHNDYMNYKSVRMAYHFTFNETDKIKDIIINSSFYMGKGVSIIDEYNNGIVVRLNMSNISGNIFINKYEDEWYLARVYLQDVNNKLLDGYNITYYLCDQFYSVLALIRRVVKA